MSDNEQFIVRTKTKRLVFLNFEAGTHNFEATLFNITSNINICKYRIYIHVYIFGLINSSDINIGLNTHYKKAFLRNALINPCLEFLR